MICQVVAANSADGAGTPASASASVHRSAGAQQVDERVRSAVVSAPASAMPCTYSSKWLMKPPPSSSLSSTMTMSLMSRRLPVGPVGIHGTVTQVSCRCNDFSRDMKSQTAKTWCSMKVTSASWVSRLA